MFYISYFEKVFYIDFGDSQIVTPESIRSNAILTEVPAQCNNIELAEVQCVCCIFYSFFFNYCKK